MSVMYSTVLLREVKGTKRCYRCKILVSPPEEQSHRHIFLGRYMDYCNRRDTFICTDCVGFFASRYSFYKFPDLTDAEKKSKLKYDNEILMKAYPPLPIEQETPNDTNSS